MTVTVGSGGVKDDGEVFDLVRATNDRRLMLLGDKVKVPTTP